MKRFFFIFSAFCVSSLVSCQHLGGLLSDEDAHEIGQVIWFNEASKREDLLVFWNKYEPFPSLGIGHNIWFPEGQEFEHKQMFPSLCDYLQEHDIELPQWLEQAKDTGAPWQTREEFYDDAVRRQELRNLLVTTMPLQTHFMVTNFKLEMPKILYEAKVKDCEKIVSNVYKLEASKLGLYALIDYLNFKGSGIKNKENGWGLLQVLSAMPEEVEEAKVNKAFAASAALILAKRIHNSGPEYNDIRWLDGWMNRIAGYADPGIFERVAAIEPQFG